MCAGKTSQKFTITWSKCFFTCCLTFIIFTTKKCFTSWSGSSQWFLLFSFNLPAQEFSNLRNCKLESDYLMYLTTWFAHYAKLITIQTISLSKSTFILFIQTYHNRKQKFIDNEKSLSYSQIHLISPSGKPTTQQIVWSLKLTSVNTSSMFKLHLKHCLLP